MKFSYFNSIFYFFLMIWVIVSGWYYSVLFPAILSILFFILSLFLLNEKIKKFPINIFSIVPSVIVLSEKMFIIGFVTLFLIIVQYYFSQSPDEMRNVLWKSGIFAIIGSAFCFAFIQVNSLFLDFLFFGLICALFFGVLFIKRYGNEYIKDGESA